MEKLRERDRERERATLAIVAQVIGAPSRKLGHGLQVCSPVRASMGGNQSMFLTSMFLFLLSSVSSFISKEFFKSLGKDYKKEREKDTHMNNAEMSSPRVYAR